MYGLRGFALEGVCIHAFHRQKNLLQIYKVRRVHSFCARSESVLCFVFNMLRYSSGLAQVTIILAAIVASAKDCPTPPWQVNRIRPLQSSNSTLSARINNVPAEKELVQQILNFYRRLGQRSEDGTPNGGRWECHTQPILKAHFDSVKRLMSHFGFGKPHDCLSVIDDGAYNDKTHRSSLDLYDSIVKFNHIVKSYAPDVLRDYGIGWDVRNIFLNELLLDIDSPEQYRQCVLAKSLAYRVNGTWGLVSMFTNVSNDIAVRANERGYFSETVSLTENQEVVPFNFRMPTCEKVTTEPEVKMNLMSFETGSAYNSSWEGKPTWSHFGMREMSLNPALQTALLRGQHEKEIVGDSQTPSNLAILLLPAALALVPLGLFQDVSLAVTLLYTLATDVISVLPVAIKGIELIVYGSKVHTATVSYLYGAGNLNDLAAGETWVAKCRMKPNLKFEGIAILTTALATMIVGILLEFLTRVWVKRLRRRHRMDVDEFLKKDLPEPEASSSGGLLWMIQRGTGYESYV